MRKDYFSDRSPSYILDSNECFAVTEMCLSASVRIPFWRPRLEARLHHRRQSWWETNERELAEMLFNSAFNAILDIPTEDQQLPITQRSAQFLQKGAAYFIHLSDTGYRAATEIELGVFHTMLDLQLDEPLEQV